MVLVTGWERQYRDTLPSPESQGLGVAYTMFSHVSVVKTKYMAVPTYNSKCEL